MAVSAPTRRGNPAASLTAGSAGGLSGTLVRTWRAARGIHPGLVLAFLDAVGLSIASYLSITELTGGLVQCGPLHGCQDVQHSSYAWIGPVPVALFGVFLSITLLALALAWWRTGRYQLLVWHYALSLVGVMFEGWFQFAQFFLIHAFCVWCETYGISLILRFVIAAWVYFRTPKPNATVPA